jgi:hypothetical protein
VSAEDRMEFETPEGKAPTVEELMQAISEGARAKPHEMDCPVIDCSGRIEAGCSIWFNISAEGLPYVHGIGWFEGGKFFCSEGGAEHVPFEYERRLWATVSEFCASLEKQLGSQTQEDELPGGQVIWGNEDGN